MLEYSVEYKRVNPESGLTASDKWAGYIILQKKEPPAPSIPPTMEWKKNRVRVCKRVCEGL